ncbi:MAG: hypothetical protein ABSH46_13455 [Bryobacteraceae bacterium]
MKHSLRRILADSHVSAVAIAVLLLWSLDSGFRALAGFLITALAILGVPYFSIRLTVADRLLLVKTLLYLLDALISLAAAWLLSHWVYGVGPLRSLGGYGTRGTRRNHD